MLQYKSGTTTEAESEEVAVSAEGLIQEPESMLSARGGLQRGGVQRLGGFEQVPTVYQPGLLEEGPRACARMHGGGSQD
jgi:hypothetical protein